MHSMNGFIYGNLPGLDMEEGDTVRWHLAAFGTEVKLAVFSCPTALYRRRAVCDPTTVKSLLNLCHSPPRNQGPCQS